MLVLLPPSEAKTPARRGAALDLETLSFPELTASRERVLDALVDLARTRPETAREVLGLSERQRDEVLRDAGLMTEPTAAAGRVYSGVIYESLDLASLDAAAKRRATRCVVVQSALFGAVRLTDRIPAYRLSGDSVIPSLGSLAAVWRDPLATAMTAAAGRGLVIDLRSGVYAHLWRPTGAVAERTVAVRVLQEMPDGSRKVVSHFNKATKGRLLRTWLVDGADPRSLDELADACEKAGVAAEPGPRPKPGRPMTLDVVVPDL